MRNRLLTVISILFAVSGLRYIPATAQEKPGFTLSINGASKEYHDIGCAFWTAPAAPDGALSKGYSIHYFSGTFLADVDLAGKKVMNMHFNPHFHLTAAYLSEKGFKAQLRAYPILGVANVSDKDSLFDWGMATTLSAGGKVGLSVLGRITRHTRAVGFGITF